MAHKEGIIAAASVARSIEMDPSWIIDGQVHAFVKLPRATRTCQNAGGIVAAAISHNERYSQKFIMRTNISRGDATNVNLCRQLQMQFTELHARLSRAIAACVYVSADRGAYQTAKFANNAQQRYNLILHSTRVHA